MSYQPYVDPVGMDPRHYGFVDSVKRLFIIEGVVGV